MVVVRDQKCVDFAAFADAAEVQPLWERALECIVFL